MVWRSLVGVGMIFLFLGSAEARRTDELFWDCTGRSDPKEVGMALCIGYVMGMMDAHTVATAIGKGRPLMCLPANGISNEQAIRIFVQWVERNPQSMHNTVRMSLLIALAEAFPCNTAR